MEALVHFVQAQVDQHLFGIQQDPQSYSHLRIFLGYWLTIYALVLPAYFLMCGVDYYLVFVRLQKKNFPNGDKVPPGQHRRDILLSVASLCGESFLVAFFYVGIDRGHSKMYYDVHANGHGWLTLAWTTVAFVILSDAMIYWIHRGLHHPAIYAYIHKPHHSTKFITPWTAHAFHPLDGFLQGLPYYLFVYFLPMHHIQHTLLLFLVHCWTISIHDRYTMCEKFGINGAGHHDIHHTKTFYNYGQYFTLWDKMCGTHMTDDEVEKEFRTTAHSLTFPYTPRRKQPMRKSD